MNFSRKLKPAPLGSEFLLPLFAVPGFLIIMAIWGIRMAWAAVGAIEFLVVLMHLNLYFRTRNSSFLWLAAAFFIIVLFALQVSYFGETRIGHEGVPMTIAAICAFFIMGFIVFTRKVKWRTREILELAAMPVDEAKNGFTGRPMPLGKIEASENEIRSFTRFLAKNLIAMPYRESNRTVYSLTGSYWKQNGFSRGYEDESWVSLSSEGEVIVSISQNDYLMYRDTFSFDQLCHSLGSLFIEFFELFRRGEGIRIMDKLNALRLNPITE